jgi:hypothetical protein
MADLSSVNDNFFTIASETFADNLSSGIAAGALIVPVNNASEYTNGDCVVLTVEPGTVNEATFIGKKNGNQFEECIWTEGNTAVPHSSGATIIDYDSATHHNAQTKGIKKFANDDGTLLAQPIRDALGLVTSSVNGWEVLPYTIQVSSGYNKGAKSHEIVIPNADATGNFSKGMKLRFDRSTTAPTQCTDLERSSSQYATRVSASLTGSLTTITDDFSCEAWVKLEDYNAAAIQTIVGRLSSTAGWAFGINALGQLDLYAFTSSGANIRRFTSYQSIEVGKWVHVALTIDLSGSTGVAYINGISVGGAIVNTGSAVAAITQAGDLSIGRAGALNQEYFDGKITDVRIWNAIRTQTQIRDNMNQQLVGSETNLVGYWKLNGDFVDSTSAANTLTGQGSATATTLDNPMKNTEYGYIMDITYSAPNTVLSVFTGTKNNVPNMTLTSPYYSTQDAPYGFPCDKGNWRFTALFRGDVSQSSAVSGTWYNFAQVTVPLGAWDCGYFVDAYLNESSGAIDGRATLSTANNAEYDSRLTFRNYASTSHYSVVGECHLNLPPQLLCICYLVRLVLVTLLYN